MSASQLRITNPIPAGDQFPSVVEIIAQDSIGRNYQCSGVFISESVLITAAHCIYDDDGRPNSKITYTAPDHKVHEAKFYPSLNYDPNKLKPGAGRYDLAFLSFDEPCAPAVSEFGGYSPKRDDGKQYKLVGYGSTSNTLSTGNRIKNFGINEVHSIDGNYIVFAGWEKDAPDGPNFSEGQLSVTGKGDSGGALFDSDNKLVGVIKGTTDFKDEKYGKKIGSAIIMDINHEISRSELSAISRNYCAGNAVAPTPCEMGMCSIQ